MNTVAEKVATLWPEIIMMIGAVVCLFLGLASSAKTRKAAAAVAGITIILAAMVVPFMSLPQNGLGLGAMTVYLKIAILGMGFVLWLVAAKVPDTLRQVMRAESARDFEPGVNVRGEFFAFFLMSLSGAMLTAGADGLIWLFLALELTSLPTYVLVAISRDHIDSFESAVKYFFLGALGAAMFVYGFALIYGATGFTTFAIYNDEGQLIGGVTQAIAARITDTGSISVLTLAGLTLSVVGIGFKIAAVPMHFYAADVYQGSSTSVTAFLAFVPKTAGFAALIVLLSTVGWPLDPTPVVDTGDALVVLLWIMAAVTMTVGNVLALLQDNVKRVLAYSSIAHSGYLLVGILAGTAAVGQAMNTTAGPTTTAQAAQTAHDAPLGGALANGLGGVLFYLVAYGLATTAAFAVLGCLQSKSQTKANPAEGSNASQTLSEAQTFDDIRGLIRTHPALAIVMVISMLSLIGLPPLVGFVGKLYLIGPAYQAGFLWLVLILVVNSAIGAAYYLRIAGTCIFTDSTDDQPVNAINAPARRFGAALAAILTLVLGFGGGWLANWANQATALRKAPSAQASSTPTASSIPASKTDSSANVHS